MSFLRTHDSTYVAIRQHSEVIPLHIQERQNKEPPPLKHNQASPALEAVLVDRVARVYQIKQDVIEERLERGDRRALGGK
jgi:hypothetical protein